MRNSGLISIPDRGIGADRELMRLPEPEKINTLLDRRDGFTEQKRKLQYDMLSEYASHASAVGFCLIAPQGLGEMGPFYSAKYLQALIEELVKYAVQGALIFSKSVPTENQELMRVNLLSLKCFETLRRRYLEAEKNPDPS